MAKINWISAADEEEQQQAQQALQEQKEELDKALPAILTAVRKMIDVDDLTDDELLEMQLLFPQFIATGHKYSAGDVFNYEGGLYRVRKGLTTNGLYPPDKTPSEYTPILPPGVIGAWEQRSWDNPYKPGDKVKWQGDIYLCKLETSYNPTDYPPAWEKE